MVRMIPADMRRAAAAWDAAGEQVKSANPADRVGDLSTAMRGGASARHAGELARKFDDRFSDWCAEAAQTGESYRAVADDHQVTDQNAGAQGSQHVSAVSGLPSTWAAEESQSKMLGSGPAIFDPAASPSDRMANLAARLGGGDS